MRRTPTGWLIIIISWMVFLSGLMIGGVFIFYVGNWKLGLTLVGAGIVMALLLRLIANIGESLFHLYANSCLILQKISQIGDHADTMNLRTESLSNEISRLKGSLETIVIDLQSLNNSSAHNIHEVMSLMNSLSNSLEDNVGDIKSLINTLNVSSQSTTKDMIVSIEALSEKFLSVGKNLKDTTNSIHNVEHALQQINCDSHDVNQHVYKLVSFLEEIEKRLDLNK